MEPGRLVSSESDVASPDQRERASPEAQRAIVALSPMQDDDGIPGLIDIDEGEDGTRFVQSMTAGERARARRRIVRDDPPAQEPEWSWTMPYYQAIPSAGSPLPERPTQLREIGSPPPRIFTQSRSWASLAPEQRQEPTKPVLHLFCAADGCEQPLVCSRALEVKT